MPGSKHKVLGAAHNERVNVVQVEFARGEAHYGSDATFAFLPHRDIDIEAIFGKIDKRFVVTGEGWNSEAGMHFKEVPAAAHIYENGLVALEFCRKDMLKELLPYMPHRRAVRKRVASTDHGIIRESGEDVTLRIRITKDNMAASGSSIRELLDNEVFKLLSQLPS